MLPSQYIAKGPQSLWGTWFQGIPHRLMLAPNHEIYKHEEEHSHRHSDQDVVPHHVHQYGFSRVCMCPAMARSCISR